MVGLALVLFVHAATGSFGAAGATVGLYGAGTAVGGVLQSRLIDRTRQTPVLVASAIVHALGLVGVVATTPIAVALGQFAAALAGVALPQLTPCMRAVWLRLATDDGERRAALALDAVVVEGVFLVGPALVAGLLFVVPVATVLALTAASSALGTLGFAASAPSLRWRPSVRSRGFAGPLASPGVVTLLLTTALFGVADGLLQLGLSAFAVRHGMPAFAGLALAVVSVASVAGGLAYGARAWPADAATRFAILHVLLAAALVLAGVAGRPVVLLVLLLLPGMCIAPIATEGSVLLHASAPAGTQTEAYAWSITAVVLGGAAGAAGGGIVVDRLPLAAVLAVASAAVTVAAAAAWGLRRSLRGAEDVR